MTDRLARMKELEAKATQGEWSNQIEHYEGYAVGIESDGRPGGSIYILASMNGNFKEDSFANSAFIAELRNAAKDLIELVEEAKFVIEHGLVSGHGSKWLSKLSEFQNEGEK